MNKCLEGNVIVRDLPGNTREQHKGWHQRAGIESEARERWHLTPRLCPSGKHAVTLSMGTGDLRKEAFRGQRSQLGVTGQNRVVNDKTDLMYVDAC